MTWWEWLPLVASALVAGATFFAFVALEEGAVLFGSLEMNARDMERSYQKAALVFLAVVAVIVWRHCV